ncbi:MAG: phosphatidylethanolamine N-methyltransferase family protein [Nitrosomonas sp.]|nr:phosphatidylethanolamine N-methyltransferase family protein [Nitrosomonas sp.]
MTNDNPTIGIWVGQTVHFVCLALLLALLYVTWIFLGESFPAVFWIAVAFPVSHQIYVWLAWRLELRCAGTSKTIGFGAYVFLFFVLFFGRFISLLALAWVDRGSLNLSATAVVILTILLALPGIYAMYSVNRYFGMSRAAGVDHFDPRYRSMPLVNEGIFRFTSNGMYLYAFLLFWAIAIGFNSSAALAVATFSHLYIWVHYFATERPDMNYLYSAANRRMQADHQKASPFGGS